MQPFEFTLPNERKKWYDRSVMFLFAVNGMGVFLKWFYSGPYRDRRLVIFLSLAALFVVACQFFIVYTQKFTRYQMAFIAASAALSLYWFYLGPWWWGLLGLLLTVLYIPAQGELKIVVGPEQIIFPSFPRKRIGWHELNNLILKDGLLTIDFRNNRIIQLCPDLKMNGVNEQEFNEFCRKQLMANPS